MRAQFDDQFFPLGGGQRTSDASGGLPCEPAASRRPRPRVAAEFGAELAEPAHGQVAERRVDLARRMLHGRIDSRGSRSSGVAGAVTRPLASSRSSTTPACRSASSYIIFRLGQNSWAAEVDDRLDHVQRRRIGRRLGAAGLADDQLDLGELPQDRRRGPSGRRPPASPTSAARVIGMSRMLPSSRAA